MDLVTHSLEVTYSDPYAHKCDTKNVYTIIVTTKTQVPSWSSEGRLAVAFTGNFDSLLGYDRDHAPVSAPPLACPSFTHFQGRQSFYFLLRAEGSTCQVPIVIVTGFSKIATATVVTIVLSDIKNPAVGNAVSVKVTALSSGWPGTP